VNCPAILLIPLMMLADHYFTVWSASLRARIEGSSDDLEALELNPLFKRSVSELRWIDWKHHLGAIFVAAGLILVTEVDSGDDLGEVFLRTLLGICLVPLSIVMAKHVVNLLTYQGALRRRSRGEETGALLALAVDPQFQYSINVNLQAGVLFVLAVVALLEPGPFVLGGLAAGLAQLGQLVWWRRKARGVDRTPRTSPGSESPPFVGPDAVDERCQVQCVRGEHPARPVQTDAHTGLVRDACDDLDMVRRRRDDIRRG